MEKEAGSELERFVKLHAQHDGTTELFYKLEKAAGLEKVFQHIEELDSLFGFNKRDFREEVIITDRWADFTAGKTESLETLMKKLELTREADGQKIKTLIRRAHFVRFPECDASELTETKMLHALGFSSALAKQIIDATPQINWSTEIVQQGPMEKDEHKAPYTSIISPTMSGKTRLLKELAKHVCVVYVCLRKAGSTGQPPRSHLARHFIPEEPKLNMIRHYSHLLIAILKTVHDFFEQPDRRTKSLKDLLSEWFDYSFQMDNTPKSEFNLKVEKELKELNEANSPKPNPTWDDIRIGDLETRNKLAAAASKVAAIMEFEKHGNLKVLLAIDEASNLIDHIDKQLQIPYFRVFRRAPSGIPFSMGFFSVFADTTSRLANFNPALDRDPCSRFHSRGVGLFAPIYKISAFDAFVPKKSPARGTICYRRNGSLTMAAHSMSCISRVH
ncbi:hypothetical protein H4Q26_002286 [Puccinia striiformis f. sp. tritici PST-130]|nr:hypothetical protein H4Q26_002286 [Puccinia striiformis f. sp. tritici PST-130]